MQAGEQQELDLSNSDVVTKYKAAAEICNKAIVAVVDACKDGAKVVDVCRIGDDLIQKEVQNIFKGKKFEKGIAFPTCVAANSVVGHFSPLSDDATAIKDGDLVKIDLGCHIDGWIATQATTIQVGAGGVAAPITGRAADVVAAARTAFDVAIRMIKPGKKATEVSEKLAQAVAPFGCQLVEGVLSHDLKQFVIDGNKTILNRAAPDQKTEDCEFEPNEVYAIDIVVSSGEGKPKVLDEKETTVYKRALDVEYKLKMKASRVVLGAVSKKFPMLPFSLRALTEGEGEDVAELKKQLRLGLVECLTHGLLTPYPVLHEKGGELVAQIKGTVLLMPNGSDKITSCPQQPVETDMKVEDAELIKLLNTGLKTNKKKKKAAAGGENGAAE
ncbi:MAG: peptidase M24, structural domain-containing protein [Monoraphidium minutum]|nr:MAG: peptidase M24, structural domain-containing protein [Monoraphidium minutum]